MPLSSPRLRQGVTLIELLIVILIISILAGLVVGVASIANESAREAHTRHVVERLHTLLTDYYGTFRTRRARLSSTVEQDLKTQAASKGLNGAKQGGVLAEARLYALREMMLMDIPDRWSDVILEPVESFSSTAPPIAPVYLEGRTELSNVYFRRFQQLVGRTNSITGVANTPDQIRQNQGAECLYMVITLATGEGEARSQFGENSIGDTDGDGAPEFLDGWNHPISFLRWAPGFESQIQLDANQLGAAAISNVTWTTAANSDHEPFDLFRGDPLAFRLLPLIYSGGRDEATGLNEAPTYITWRTSLQPPKIITNSAPYSLLPRLTPYQNVLDPATSVTAFLGTSKHLIDPTVDETSTDNVHNHLLGKR